MITDGRNFGPRVHRGQLSEHDKSQDVVVVSEEGSISGFGVTRHIYAFDTLAITEEVRLFEYCLLKAVIDGIRIDVTLGVYTVDTVDRADRRVVTIKLGSRLGVGDAGLLLVLRVVVI